MRQANVDRLIKRAATLCTIERRATSGQNAYGEVTFNDYAPLATVPCVYSTPTPRGRRITIQTDVWVEERHLLVSGTTDVVRDDRVNGVVSTLNGAPSATINNKTLAIIDIVQDTPLVKLLVTKEVS